QQPVYGGLGQAQVGGQLGHAESGALAPEGLEDHRGPFHRLDHKMSSIRYCRTGFVIVDYGLIRWSGLYSCRTARNWPRAWRSWFTRSGRTTSRSRSRGARSTAAWGPARTASERPSTRRTG